MKETTMVNFRMDKALKKEMENVCKELGMSMTTAFTIFAKKVVRERRIPFDLSLYGMPLNIENMTSNELTSELEKGYDDMKEGRVKEANQVFSKIYEEI